MKIIYPLPEVAFGFDFGNTMTDGATIIQGETFTKSLPSLSMVGNIRNLTDKQEALASLRDVSNTETVYSKLKNDEVILNYDGIDYFIGNLAMKQGNPVSTKDDILRYTGLQSQLFMMACSGMLISNQSYKMYVVSGLPIESFNIDNRREIIKAHTRSYNFTLQGKQRYCEVEVLNVIMEGAGILIHSGSKDDVPQCVIDIGGRTTDIFTANGQTPNVHRCKGYAVGVETVGDTINTLFEGAYGSKLSTEKIQAILKAAIGKGTWPMIYAHKKQVPTEQLQLWAKNSIQTVGSQIVSFAAGVLSSSEKGDVAGDLAKVILGGRGAWYFGDIIEKRFGRVDMSLSPGTDNAEGYAELALKLMHRRKPMTQAG